MKDSQLYLILSSIWVVGSMSATSMFGATAALVFGIAWYVLYLCVKFRNG